jgi:hypothetical protein
MKGATSAMVSIKILADSSGFRHKALLGVERWRRHRNLYDRPRGGREVNLKVAEIIGFLVLVVDGMGRTAHRRGRSDRKPLPPTVTAEPLFRGLPPINYRSHSGARPIEQFKQFGRYHIRLGHLEGHRVARRIDGR